jgi:hypothetical protein
MTRLLIVDAQNALFGSMHNPEAMLEPRLLSAKPLRHSPRLRAWVGWHA